MSEVVVRAYGNLNDFLPNAQHHAAVTVTAEPGASVKDIIERLGIPHPEVDLLLADGQPVGFGFAPPQGCRIAVFPRFHAIEVDEITCVRPLVPSPNSFVLDGHLGKLAKHLRLLGLDATCPPGATDDVLAQQSADEGRILLTRDVGLLKRRIVSLGYFVRETMPRRQIVEILRQFGPLPVEPFSRCLRCNGELRDAPKPEVEAALPPRTRECVDDFLACAGCGRVYWKGAHWARLTALVEDTLKEARYSARAGLSW
ncbi:MAG: Mut7-C RNAse domain-containing protein [Bacteroidales bacterium]